MTSGFPSMSVRLQPTRSDRLHMPARTWALIVIGVVVALVVTAIVLYYVFVQVPPW